MRGTPDRLSGSFPRPPRLRVAGAVLAGTMLAVLGCTTTRTSTATSPSTPGPDATKATARPERVSDAPVRSPGLPGSVVGSAVSIDFRPLGHAATDGFTLPVFSPDGRSFAVQTGAVPDRATLLARPGQRAPVASRIAAYRIEEQGLVRLGETDGGLVLGRHADARGYLVESPRPDGARWIGRIAWNSTEVEWVVQDGRVNAFAALGPGGEIAFSSREVRERRFDLVVRRDGRNARLSADGARSYLYPTFDGDGTRVLAFCARDGILEFASADPASDDSLRQTLSRALVSDRATDETASQMVAPQGVRDGVDGRDWIVFHPWLGSLVRWNAADGLRALPGNVLARGAIAADSEAVLVGGRVRARLRNVDSATLAKDPGTAVYDRVAVPRMISMGEGEPAVLLLVPEGGGLRILLARFRRTGTTSGAATLPEVPRNPLAPADIRRVEGGRHLEVAQTRSAR